VKHVEVAADEGGPTGAFNLINSYGQVDVKVLPAAIQQWRCGNYGEWLAQVVRRREPRNDARVAEVPAQRTPREIQPLRPAFIERRIVGSPSHKVGHVHR
jgi:hypothetical protein